MRNSTTHHPPSPSIPKIKALLFVGKLISKTILTGNMATVKSKITFIEGIASARF